MGQETSQLLVMGFLPAAAAFHVTMDKIVVHHINLVAAITPAMPDHRLAILSVTDRVQGSKHFKFLPGDIRVSIVFLMDIAWASCAAAIDKQGALYFVFVAAGALTYPHSSSGFWILSPTQYGKFTENLSGKIRGYCLC